MAVEMFYVAFRNSAIESVIGSVEGHNGQELNWLEIEIWLAEKGKQGLHIEYLSREELAKRKENLP